MTPALDELRAANALHQHAQARSRRSRLHLAELARSAYTQGATLEQIGEVFGVSRQRAHQIINEPKGTQ